MIPLVIVVVDEGFDLSFKVNGQEVVFQQDAVLQGLMPSFDLALDLRVIRRTMLGRARFPPRRRNGRLNGGRGPG